MNTNPTQSTANIATIERQLRAKWAELLGVEEIEIAAHSDFLSLGGNSMLLLALHSYVTQEFNTVLLVTDLIENAAFGCMVELLCGMSHRPANPQFIKCG